MTTARRLDIVAKLRGEFGQPLVILPWWRTAFEAMDDPNIHEIVLSLTRQTGKSQLLASMAASELFTTPNAYVLMVAASEDQASAIFSRKLRKPLDALMRSLGISKKAVVIGEGSISIPSTGGMLEVIPTAQASAPGRSPTLLILDEARYIADDTFAVLAPSVIGGGGKMVIASSAGPPSGFFFNLVQNPTANTFLYQSGINDNPHANPGVLSFIRRRLALLVPSSAARELDNQFAEDGESFLKSELIEAAIDNGLGECSSPAPAFAFLDLSRKKDLTSVVVVVRLPPRRPEQADHVQVASIRTWDPRTSPTKETNFAEVREHLAGLPVRFPGLVKILVDEGAEAGSILPFARSHPLLSARVEGFIATAESNMGIWGALSGRLHAQTISIPRHERLIAEMRGLRQESFSFGSKWRVVDSSKKFHRDVAVSLAGACFAAGGVVVFGPLGDSLVVGAPVTTSLEAGCFGHGGANLNDAFGASSGFRPF